MKLVHSNIQRGIIVSIVIHASILIIFLLIRFNWTLDIPEFVEIRFERGAAAMKTVTESPVQAKNQDDFDLPVRRDAQLNDEGFIDFEDKEKFVPLEKVNIVSTKSDDKLLPTLNTRNANEMKEVAEPSLDEKIVPDFSANTETAGDSPYQIEGKAAKRAILSKVIPQYPENVQQEAVIKIRFSVLPNGLVGEMIPVLKSHDLLERITLNAFKQWRFNPLSPDVEQVPEYGTITFKYLLQ